MLEELIKIFYQNRNNDRAINMAAYMKHNFSFLGISKPDRSVLQSDFMSHALKTASTNWEVVFQLWDLPEREFQYLAVEYLLKKKKLLQKEHIAKLKILLTTKPWWDTVDSLAGNIVGALCAKHPELVHSEILKWAESNNIWLIRAAILFQLKYKDKTSTEVLSEIILQNNDTKEFFINKAIGWALREYSKTNKVWVKTFIASNPLPSLSVREGSKYI